MVRQVMQKWRAFRELEKGTELIEWAVVTLIMAMAGVVTLILVRDELGKMFENVLMRLMGS